MPVVPLINSIICSQKHLLVMEVLNYHWITTPLSWASESGQLSPIIPRY